jgi:hypothetical protein
MKVPLNIIYSLGTAVFSTNKTDRQNITKILLSEKVEDTNEDIRSGKSKQEAINPINFVLLFSSGEWNTVL